MLHGQRVDAVWATKFRILNGFLQRKTRRKEWYQEITSWPLLNICSITMKASVGPSNWIQSRCSVPSSKIVLSPNMTISKSPYASSRFKIYRIGFDLALQSMAHTPTTSVMKWKRKIKDSFSRSDVRTWGSVQHELPIELLSYIFLCSQ